MVELWGNTLSFIGSLFGILIDTILFDAFFPRKRPERYYWPLIVTGTFIIFMFSILVGNRFGYTFAILFEIAVYYLLCAFLYQSRWDRRLFVVVTNYAILYSASYWGDALCIFFLDLTYEEYPQKGLYTAISYTFTDLILLASILVLALLLVRQERDSGLLSLVRSLPAGRLHTALAKLGSFALSLLAVLVLLYGVNLAYCAATFGLGPLSRTIQSVPALMRCTMQITVGECIPSKG